MTEPTPPPQPVIYAVRDATIGFGLWPWAKGQLWRLANPWEFRVEGVWHDPVYGYRWFVHRYTIPGGYEFDGQSVPGVFHGFPFYYGPAGVGLRAGLEHDFLCDLLAGGSPWLRERLDFAGLDPNPPAPPVELIHEHYQKTQLADGQRPRKAAVSGWAVATFGPGTAIANAWRRVTFRKPLHAPTP